MPDTIGYRRVLGVLVPYFNTAVQPELDDLRPPGVSNQTARFTVDENVLRDVTDAATKLMTCGPAALIIGLATESFPGGLVLLQQGADDIARQTKLPVYTASHATHAALRRLGVERIGVVTPFDAAANEHVRESLEAQGFSVVSIGGLACADLDAIPQSAPDDIRRIFRQVDRTDAEALLQVGTGLPVLQLVDELERSFGKPVVACNAAVYWQTLRETGIDDKVNGFGRLLAEY